MDTHAEAAFHVSMADPTTLASGWRLMINPSKRMKLEFDNVWFYYSHYRHSRRRATIDAKCFA
jgi:hypothetical protein